MKARSEEEARRMLVGMVWIDLSFEWLCLGLGYPDLALAGGFVGLFVLASIWSKP